MSYHELYDLVLQIYRGICGTEKHGRGAASTCSSTEASDQKSGACRDSVIFCAVRCRPTGFLPLIQWNDYERWMKLA